MTSNAIETLRPVTGPGRVGQSTAVEQSRAVAEVQAAVIVAQQCPRSVQLAIEAMEEACRQVELAEVAFFRFPRAGETVEGPSVHLARELARCWGNIQYGVRELARDDVHRQSEMQAWAWDVQTNTRDSSDFIVPHQRDTKKGVKDLADLRDIYENNANNGARRLREMIFAMLPVWYRARAEKLCRQTIENGGGVPLAQRVADAVRAFERYRVSPARLAARFGYKGVDELTATDVAQLGVIYSSIQQGTVTVDDEFAAEPDRIAPDDLAPAADAKPARTRTAAKPKTAEPATDAASGDTGPAPAPEAAQTPEDPTASGASSSAHAPASASPQRTAAPSPSTSNGSGAAPARMTVGSDSPGTVTDPQLKAIWTILGNVFKVAKDEAGKEEARLKLASIVGRELPTTTVLSFNEAGKILDTLDLWRREAADAAASPREYLDLMTAPQAAQDGADGGE